MTRRTRTIRAGALAVALAASAVLAGPMAANATTGTSPSLTMSPTVQGMTVVGYDAAVAAANGYEIQTDANGRQQSVPVTDQAKARAAEKVDTVAVMKQKVASKGVSTNELIFDEVVGDCGLSYVGAEKGANDVVSYETGYVVRDAVAEYTWAVTALGTITGETDNYADPLPSDAEFYAEGTLTAIGPGTAFVPPLSAAAQATLIDGAICYSGGPGVGFP